MIAGGWHLALFKDVYARLGVFTRPRPIVPLGVLSMVLQLWEPKVWDDKNKGA